MSNAHGEFIWYELITPDLDAAAEFYGALLGWTTKNQEPDGSYRVWSAGAADVGGLMAPPAEAGCEMPPAWFGYIGVDDVDATVAKLKAAGGGVRMPPTNVPGVCHFAMVTDPQGVAFYVMRGSMDGTSDAFHPSHQGHCAWNELVSTDPKAALGFYCDLFGWEKGDAMPMGAMGDYQFIHHGSAMIGGVMQRPAGEGPPADWNFYFRVADIDVAARIATDRGATLTHGPGEVPGGDYIIQGIDPQGASFAIVGARRA
ncbi:MAG: VOC family protein [Myxococcota bacterium]